MSEMPLITITTENNNNASPQEMLLMAPKRMREGVSISEGNLNKTPRLSQYDSPQRIIHLIDKRFEKQTELLKSLLKESESRLLSVIDKSMVDIKEEIGKLNEKYVKLDDRVQKLETLADKIEHKQSEITDLRNEMYAMKANQQKFENQQVACDLRINGIPYDNGENLYQIFANICDTINISIPTIKAMYRMNNIRNQNSAADPVIIVNLTTPSDKNFVLKNIARFRKSNNSKLILTHAGFDSNKPFYVNENLTSHNYKIFQNALKLKRQKHLESVFSLRGFVYVKRTGTDPPTLIENNEQLTQLFRETPDRTINDN